MRIRTSLLLLFATIVTVSFAQDNDSIAEVQKYASYEVNIVKAEAFLASKEYKKAKTEYQQSLKIRPDALYPKDKIEEINKIFDDPEDENTYKQAIANGDVLFATNEFEKAKTEYEKAISFKPTEKYPKERLKDIRTHISNLEGLRQIYNESIAKGDKLYKAGENENALQQYRIADSLFPGEKYPKIQLEKINKILAETKAINDAYDKAITDADNYYIEKDFANAKIEYLKANKIKPDERYPLSMIEQIKSKPVDKTVAAAPAEKKKDTEKPIEAIADTKIVKTETQKVEILKTDAQNVAEAAKKDISALAQKISGKLKKEDSGDTIRKGVIKKEETKLPETKKAETDSTIADSKVKTDGEKAATASSTVKKQEETVAAEKKPEHNTVINPPATVMPPVKAHSEVYTKAITDGDRFMNAKAFDQAMEAYKNALRAEPGEQQVLDKISALITELNARTIIKLNESIVKILNNDEKKFNFATADLKAKNKNFLLIRARITDEKQPRIFLNYGKDGQKNGGIVLRSITGTAFTDYVIKISNLDQWWRLDNNWISLYPSGGDIEIQQIILCNGE